MYKPISNYNNRENPSQKSLLCSQVEKGEIVAGQLLCCPNDVVDNGEWNGGKCKDYTSDCLNDNKRIAKCHDITNFGACQRNDVNAARVCGWQDVLFCISARSPSNDPDYLLFPEAAKWMVSRNTSEESFNATNTSGNNDITICDRGQGYQLCNNIAGSTAYLTCGDLLSKEYTCDWYNISGNKEIAHVARNPLGELCEIKPVIVESASTTTTETLTPNPDFSWKVGQNIALTTYIPLGIVLGVTWLSLAVWWCRLKNYFMSNEGNEINPGTNTPSEFCL